MPLDRDTVTAALKTITDPVAGSDIVASGVVRALNVSQDGAVRFVMEIPPSQAKAFEAVKAEAEAALGQLEGIGRISIAMTGHVDKAPPPDLKPSR
ncbi:MAG: iron-sulfur cluster assembly protein, partial [Pseudomonadota bacterium]